MTITLNGEDRELDPATSIGALVDDVRPSGRRGVAVALNGAVVRRRQWDDVQLQDDDRVELLVAVQGG